MKMTLLKNKIALLLLSILSIPSLSFAQGNDVIIDRIAAQIGDQIILHSQIENQKQQALYQGMSPALVNNCMILEELLFQSLLVNQAEIDSIIIPEAQVEQEIDRRLAYYSAQIGSLEELEKFYGMSVAEIKEEFYIEVEAKMMADEMERTITSDVSISPKEVKSFFNDLPKDSIPYINSQVVFGQIVIKPEITQADKDRRREELNSIRKSIVSGDKSFSSMAVLYSEDPGSRKNGGEFDYVSRGTFVPEFDATAFSLKAGEISEVFETSYGFHILELIDRRGEQYKGRHILLMPKVSDSAIVAAATKADSILALIKADKYTFGEAAAKFSDDESTKNNNGKFFNPQTGNSKWDMAELDRGMFQAIDRLDVGDLSSVETYIDMEGARAFRFVKLLERTKPHVASLESDYQYIQSAALNYKKQKAIDEWISKNIATAYINLKDEYRSCDFNYDWQKVK